MWEKMAKKKFFALMCIVLIDFNDGKLNSFYDMWNHVFPAEV